MSTFDGQQKIFGIGLNKTGTSTLGQCGRLLGLRCTTCDRDLLEDVVTKNNFERIKQRVSEFDLFEDWPWPLIYKELDELFPGSKFILTTRKNEYVWLESLKHHSMRTNPRRHCRKLAYGYHYPHKKEKEHLEFYKKHNDEVREYFESRNQDFLEICWENGDGLEKLCNFLGVPPPNCALPHANKGLECKVSKRRALTNKLLNFILD